MWLAPDEPLSDIPVSPSGAPTASTRMWNEPYRTPTSAAQLIDNFLDASHFPFVHTGTFGTDEAAEVVARADRAGRLDGADRVRHLVPELRRPARGHRRAPGGPAPAPLKQGTAGYTVYLRLEFPVTGSTFPILFVCQPETATSTRIYKIFCRNDLDGDAARIESTVADEQQILDEDLAILERYAAMRIHLDQTECHTKADRLSVAWRRMLAEMVALAPADDGRVAEQPVAVGSTGR